MRLADIATIKTRFPAADFWLVRRGSAAEVGRPVRAYNPEHIGIQVTARDRIDPKYLYYALTTLHMQGGWRERAHGTTRLLNIPLEDVQRLPLGPARGLGAATARRADVDVDLELAAYLAMRWVTWGRSANSLKTLDGIAREYFGVAAWTSVPAEQVATTRAAQHALEGHLLLPMIDPNFMPAVRVNHSVLPRDEQTNAARWRVIDTILEQGLWPQAATTGKHSENPHVVFFVADQPAGGRERRYNQHVSWITADLPVQLYNAPRVTEYRGKYLIDSLRNLDGLRPGSVSAVTGVPPEFIVGVNGCPVDLFDAAVGRWGRY